jgi:hypothetical protein
MWIEHKFNGQACRKVWRSLWIFRTQRVPYKIREHWYWKRITYVQKLKCCGGKIMIWDKLENDVVSTRLRLISPRNNFQPRINTLWSAALYVGMVNVVEVKASSITTIMFWLSQTMSISVVAGCLYMVLVICCRRITARVTVLLSWVVLV